MRLRRAACAVLLALVAASAWSASQFSFAFKAADRATDIPATLIRPDGDGPFPAVVILHDCSGLGPKSSGSASLSGATSDTRVVDPPCEPPMTPTWAPST